MSSPDYWIDPEGRFRWATEPAPSKQVEFVADDVRRERTGLHATVYITLNDALLESNVFLAYDTFNLSRSEERIRLANRAAKASNGIKESYPAETLGHDLDLFCLHLLRRYEEERFIPKVFTAEDITPGISFAVDPFIIDEGGTIFFALPGSGKSLTLQTMAIEVSLGSSGIFDVQERPVLYVNLERSAASMLRRHNLLLAALGHESSPALYLHARGQSLAAVTGACKRFARQNKDGVIVLDSLSRAQVGGSLNDDTTANRFTDVMNSFGVTWAAIGHSPRGDQTHAYGSVHQDAGADIMVRVSSQKRDVDDRERLLGVMLNITKENDVGQTSPHCLAYEFHDRMLTTVRSATTREFPELNMNATSMTNTDKVMMAIEELGGNATTSQIAQFLSMDVSNVNKVLKTDAFTNLGREGKTVLYGIKTQRAEGERW